MSSQHKIYVIDNEKIGTYQFWLHSEVIAYDALSTPRVYFHGPFTFEILSDIAQKIGIVEETEDLFYHPPKFLGQIEDQKIILNNT